MALRVAAFDLDGVLALPSLAGALQRTEEALALPRGFLIDAFQKEYPGGPNEQLMRGKITFSQVTAHCVDPFGRFYALLRFHPGLQLTMGKIMFS